MRPFSEKTLNEEYLASLNRTIDYIRNHYDEELNLDRLAEVACFSKYHFHRIFRAMVGETVNEFVRRVRLEKAVHKLVLHKYKSITEIALDCGFSSSQNFARSFKAHYGFTPSYVRSEFNWDSWLMKMKKLKDNNVRGFSSNDEEFADYYRQRRNLSLEYILKRKTRMQVTVKTLPAYRVAYVRSMGSYSAEAIRSAFLKLLQWANPRGFINENTLTIGVVWNDPDYTPKEKLIYDACITVPESIKADRWVNIQTLPGGEFAIHHCEIEINRHEEEWMNLILNWLASSDYQPDDRPAYDIYHNDSETHPLKNLIVDLCLPIKPLKA